MRKTPSFGEGVALRTQLHPIQIVSGVMIATGAFLGAGLLGQAFGLWPGLVPFDRE